MPAPLTCPAAADLEQPAQFDAMLRARASSAGDIVITILGPTSGARAIQMGKLGWLMLANMLANLGRVGVTNHLAITTHLHLPAHADNNLCLSELRPRGVCCAWAGVGMRLVAEGTLGRTWTISETHPYLLFLQRWWFTSQAAARGYNVLSLDTDMHLDTNPLAMMRALPILQPTHPPACLPACRPAGLTVHRPTYPCTSVFPRRGPAYAGFGAMLQLDSGWPSEARREGQRSTDDRGQHENLVPCQPGRSSSPSPSSSSAVAAAGGESGGESPQGCACGVTPMPYAAQSSNPGLADPRQACYSRV